MTAIRPRPTRSNLKAAAAGEPEELWVDVSVETADVVGVKNSVVTTSGGVVVDGVGAGTVSMDVVVGTAVVMIGVVMGVVATVVVAIGVVVGVVVVGVVVAGVVVVGVVVTGVVATGVVDTTVEEAGGPLAIVVPA